MTHSQLKAGPDVPDERRWTLWSRPGFRPDHWLLEATGSPATCEELGAYLRPEFETLTLPPGETPVMPAGDCLPGTGAADGEVLP